MLSRIIESRKDEIIIIDNKINSSISEAQQKLEVLANDFTFNEYMQQLENTGSAYENIMQAELLQLFLQTRLSAEKQFEGIYLITDKSIIGVSVKNNSTINKRLNSSISKDLNKANIVSFIQSYGADNFINHGIHEDKMLILTLNKGEYLVGILDFDNIIGYNDNLFCIYNKQNKLVHKNRSGEKYELIVQKYQEENLGSNNKTFEIDGQRFMTVYYHSNNELFQYVLFMEIDMILDIYKRPILIISVTGILCCMTLGILYVFMSKKIIEPVHRFAKVMDEIQDFSDLGVLDDFKKVNKKYNLKAGIFVFYCLCIIPIMLIIIVSYVSFRDVVIEEAKNSKVHISQLIGRNIEEIGDSYISFAKYIALDLEFQKRMLSRIDSGRAEIGSSLTSPNEWGLYLSKVLLSKGISMKDINYVNFYDKNYELFYSSSDINNNYFSKSEQVLKNMDIYSWNVSDNGRNMILFWRIRYIPQPGYNLKTGSTLGFLEIGIKGFFSTALDLLNSITDSSKFLISKNDYQVITVSGFRNAGQSEMQLGLVDTIEWESMGFKVIGEAESGECALKLFKEKRPDVVMTDIKLPGISGLELLKNISRISPDTEFVILSGYNDFEYAQKAIDLSVFSYILKLNIFNDIEKVFGSVLSSGVN